MPLTTTASLACLKVVSGDPKPDSTISTSEERVSITVHFSMPVDPNTLSIRLHRDKSRKNLIRKVIYDSASTKTQFDAMLKLDAMHKDHLAPGTYIVNWKATPILPKSDKPNAEAPKPPAEDAKSASEKHTHKHKPHNKYHTAKGSYKFTVSP